MEEITMSQQTIYTTTKDYTVKFKGYTITIPKGSKATNQTACGIDDNYRFWIDFYTIIEKLTGFKNSLLHHDLTYYGLNIPVEYFS